MSIFDLWDVDTGYNLIHQACHYRNVELVFYLIEEVNRTLGYMRKIEYVNLKSDNTDQYFTPLHLACYTGQMKIIEFLVNNGADLNSQNEQGITMIHIAAQGDQAVEAPRPRRAAGRAATLGEHTRAVVGELC